MMNEIGEIIVGWVEERNPTFIEYHERSSVKEALLKHKTAGNSIASWEDGKIDWIQPEDIPVEGKNR